MKKKILLILVALLAVAPSAFAEVRQGGMYVVQGLGVNGDFRLGNTCVTSPGGTYYCGVNASHLSFYADNTVSLELLYPIADPGNWKVFYSNGSGVLSTLALDTADSCLKSGGPAAAPYFGTCGTGGGGDYDESDVAITGGTIDNVTMGATNVILEVHTEDLEVTATAAELDKGYTVPNNEVMTEGSWTRNYNSSAIQLLWTTTLTNGSTDDTPMHAVQVNSSGGTFDPGQVVSGVLDYTTLVASVRKDTTGKYDSWIKGDSKADTFRSNLGDGYYGDNKMNTVAPQWTNTSGMEYFWSSTFYGVVQQGVGNDQVVTYRKTKEKNLTIKAIADTDDFCFWPALYKAKFTRVRGIAQGGTNVVGQFQICDSNCGSCANTQSSDTTFTTSTTSNTTFSAGTIDANDWVKWNTTSVSGTVNFFSVTVEYYEVHE